MNNEINPIQMSSLLAFVAAFFATRFLISAHLNDAPNDRKMHNDAKATGGGIAIILGLCAAILYAQLNTNIIDDFQIYISLSAGLIIGAIALYDDIFHLDAKIRLLALILIASIIAGTKYRVETLDLGFGLILPLGLIFGAFGTIIWIVLMVNTVNFMDGVNGIAIGSMAIALFALSLLIYRHGDLSAAALSFFASCAALGFLVYNVVKGNIFAGDIGSWFIGFWYAIMGLFAVRAGVSPFLIGLCVLPLIGEVLLTIIYRNRIGDNILTPHNKHLYQLMIKTGKPHIYVAGLWWVMVFMCAIFANFADIHAQNYALPIFLVFVLIYILGAWLFRRKLEKVSN